MGGAATSVENQLVGYPDIVPAQMANTLNRFNTHYKRMKTSLTLFIYALITWIILQVLLAYGLLSSLSNGTMEIMDSSRFIKTKDNYVIDTGASSTLINQTESLGNIPIGCFFTIDATGAHKLRPLHLGIKWNITNSIECKTFSYFKIDNNTFSEWKDTIQGIIGMNVICNRNWHFMFRKNQVQILPLDILPQPKDAITLTYNDRLVPSINLEINNHVIKNVLIDTGYKTADIVLEQKYHSLLDSQNACKTESVEMTYLNSKKKEVSYIYNNLLIEDREYQNVCIHYSNRNIVGIDFLRRYDNLFWDSKNKTIYLWNE